MTQVDILPVSFRQAERPELHHVTCCEDDDLALCGSDVSAMAFTDGTGESPCVVCFDLERSDVCPLFGMCEGD